VPSVDVEVGETTDAAAVRGLRRAWAEEDVGGPLDDPGYDDAFAAWWAAEAGRRRYWLATAGGRAVGMASVVTLTRMPQPGPPIASWGYVHQMYVRPEHRDAGVGTTLLAAVVDDCRAAGLSQLVLNPRPRSTPFYRRLGFAPADHLLRLELA